MAFRAQGARHVAHAGARGPPRSEAHLVRAVVADCIAGLPVPRGRARTRARRATRADPRHRARLTRLSRNPARRTGPAEKGSVRRTRVYIGPMPAKRTTEKP